jgi:hypothetical protein
MVAAPVVAAPMLVVMFVVFRFQLEGLANHWAGELKKDGKLVLKN